MKPISEPPLIKIAVTAATPAQRFERLGFGGIACAAARLFALDLFEPSPLARQRGAFSRACCLVLLLLRFEFCLALSRQLGIGQKITDEPAKDRKGPTAGRNIAGHVTAPMGVQART
jgi:hypothetical protein